MNVSDHGFSNPNETVLKLEAAKHLIQLLATVGLSTEATDKIVDAVVVELLPILQKGD